MSNPVDVDNLNMLKELIGDDLKEILDAYLQTAPDNIYKLEQAINNKDAEQVRMQAHSLKGSSANIGAHDLSALCSELEQLAKNNTLNNATDLLAKIKTENVAVVAFLKNYMEQM